MSNTALIHGPLPETNYLYKNVVVKGNFPLASLLVHPDTKYTIKHNFDLEGQTIELPPNCILAIDGGMLYNGTLVGDDSILIDVNRLGNVLDNVIQTGTWKKQDVLNSLSIGTVISGDEPQVTITAEDGDAILNFVLPKGDKGDQGDIGDPFTYEDFTEEQLEGLVGPQGPLGRAFEYSDFTQELLESIRGPLGILGPKGVSILSFTKIGELGNDLIYNTTFDDGSVLTVNIPKGEKGDQGPQGDCLILDLSTSNSYTLYNVTGQNTDGAMTQKAVTDSLTSENISYNNILSNLAAENVQEAIDSIYENANTVTVLNNADFIYVEGVYIPSSNVWATHNGSPKNSCVMFPIKAGATYKLDIGQGVAYAILTSRGYLVGVTPQVTPQFADGFTGRRTTPKTVSIPRDSNAQYMYIATNSTQKRDVGTVTELLPNDIRVEEENKILSALDTSIYESITSAFISNEGVWASGVNTTNGAFVPVTAGKKYRISNSTDDAKVFAWLQDTTVTVGESPDWAPGNNARTGVGPGKAVDEVAPSDAAYIYIGSTGDLLTVYEVKNIPAMKDDIDSLASQIEKNELDEYFRNVLRYYDITSVELQTLSGQRSCMIDSSNKWFRDSKNERHRYLEVEETDTFIVIPSANAYLVWLTDEYDGSVTYTAGTNAPVVTGRTREVMKGNIPTLISVPTGAKYLIVTTVNGDGIAINWKVYKCNSVNIFLGLAKFKYASWNVGNFSYYDGQTGGDDPTIPDEDVEEMALRYKKVINDVSADILGINEYCIHFDASGNVDTKDEILSCYGRVNEGSEENYFCNTFASDSNKFLNAASGDVYFVNKYSGTRPYYRWLKAYFAGEEIYFIETHFNYQSSAIRQAQMQELITRFSSYPHVVISGDFNYNTGYEETENQLFTGAGYTAANGGYIGWIPTKTNTEKPLDNIVVKGFRMDNIQVNQESGTLSDHRLISCDLTLL